MLTEFPFLLLALAEITALLLHIYQGADTITICLRMCLCAYTFIHEIYKKKFLRLILSSVEENMPPQNPYPFVWDFIFRQKLHTKEMNTTYVE